MRKLTIAGIIMSCTVVAFAHVSPNVELVRRADFIRSAFPSATKFFVRNFDPADRQVAQKLAGWRPTESEAKIYIARDDSGRALGSAIFVWVPSEHGPVGVATAFDPVGRITSAAITEIGSEPLAWVRPLLAGEGMRVFVGLSPDQKPMGAKLGPAVTGTMSRYFADVIANGVAHAQLLDHIARE